MAKLLQTLLAVSWSVLSLLPAGGALANDQPPAGPDTSAKPDVEATNKKEESLKSAISCTAKACS